MSVSRHTKLSNLCTWAVLCNIRKGRFTLADFAVRFSRDYRCDRVAAYVNGAAIFADILARFHCDL